MPLKKTHFSLSPLNDQANGFSYSGGYPVIRFSIPSQEIMLETTTLKLSGRLQISDKTKALMTTAPYLDTFQLLNNDAAGAAYMPSPVAGSILPFGGVHNMIDKVVLQSKKNNVELVSETNYAQFRAIKEAYSYNKEDYLRAPLNRSLASGLNSQYTSRHMMVSSNFAWTQSDETGQYFTIHLDISLLNGMPLHLGKEFLGGLVISVYLAPDSNCLTSRYRNLGTTAQAQQADFSGATYSLKGLKLEGRYITPTPEELKAYPTKMLLNSHINLLNDIHSSVNSTSYTPQITSARGVINVFQENNAINNYLKNSINFRNIIGLVDAIQSKDGLRAPFDYKVQAIPNYKSKNFATGADLGYRGYFHNVSAIGDAEFRLLFQRAVLGGSTPYHCSVNLKATSDSMAAENDVAAAGEVCHGNNLTQDCVGIGCDYTMGEGLIQPFINSDYAIQISSGVNTGSNNLSADFNNTVFLQQTFIKNWETLDLQQLVKTM